MLLGRVEPQKDRSRAETAQMPAQRRRVPAAQTPLSGGPPKAHLSLQAGPSAARSSLTSALSVCAMRRSSLQRGWLTSLVKRGWTKVVSGVVGAARGPNWCSSIPSLQRLPMAFDPVARCCNVPLYSTRVDLLAPAFFAALGSPRHPQRLHQNRHSEQWQA